jgi:hypothetical protein
MVGFSKRTVHKIARQLVYRKTIRKFYLYDYAGFDPENGKMLYYTAAGTSNARRIG